MCYKRKQEEKRRLKLLFEKTKHNFGGGAYFDEYEVPESNLAVL